MTNNCVFGVRTTRFDENYTPSTASRDTTNFANLARGEGRRQNLRNAMTMMNTRLNALVHWDNARGDRYALDLDIVSVDLHIATAENDSSFPVIEMLDVGVVDTTTGARVDGTVGNNFSSYIRDYDFSVVLADNGAASVPDDFGELHGRVFRRFVDSTEYRRRFPRPPVICISVSTSMTYRRLTNQHPILGVEYTADEQSLTDRYFARMGLTARYFMPRGSVAPLAFYHRGDLLNDYSLLALAGTIATMESFQKIYRPEIYNANSAAADVFEPTLDNGDYSLPQVTYDRSERSRLAVDQGRFTEDALIRPFGAVLARWVASETTEPVGTAESRQSA